MVLFVYCFMTLGDDFPEIILDNFPVIFSCFLSSARLSEWYRNEKGEKFNTSVVYKIIKLTN